MRSFFLIEADFSAAPVFDEPVLEEDVKSMSEQNVRRREREAYLRSVVHLPPVVAGSNEGELSLPDPEDEDHDESGKNNDGNGPGTSDPG